MTTKLTTTNFSSSLLSLVSQPTVSAITVTDSSYTATGATAVDLSGGYIKITGNGFVSGSTVYIDSTPVTSVAFVNSTQLNCVVPAFASNSYVVYVVNIDGSVAIRVNGITYSSTPTWTSSSIQSSSPIVSIQLIASSDTAITYSLAAGSSLPSGLTLSSSGLLSGTVTGTVTVIYNFSVVATDVETQTSTRAFSVTITFADNYFKNVILLLNGETSVTPFIKDSSTNNFDLTIAGDTKPVLFNPYQGDGYYSNYFDGTGDYLTFSATTSLLDWGSSANYTIEAWVYLTAFTGSESSCILARRNPTGTTTDWQFSIGTSGTLSVYNFNNSSSVTITSTSNASLNRWNHCAFVILNGTGALYLNGIKVSADTAMPATPTTQASTYVVGASNSVYLRGYVSNLRVVKGTAVYTTSFTSPTTPLTAITNTSLLICQSNRFLDTSTNNFTLTVNGDTLISSAIPFTQHSSYSTYGSAYFDGTGDNLTVPNSAFDLTSAIWSIEYWIYPTTIASTTYYGLWSIAGTSGFRQGIYGDSGTHYLAVLNGGGGYGGFTLVAANKVITLNNWQHIALTSDGTTIRQFYNGVQTSTGSVASFTPSTPTIGSWGASSYFAGYMSNFRIVIGSSTYTANFTPPTSPLTSVTNTSLLTLQYNGSANNSGIIDNSNFNNIITRNGNTSQGTFSPYSHTGWSNYFDGSGDYLTVTGIPVPTTGQFTIEAWIYTLESGTQMIYSQYSTSDSNRFTFNIDNSTGYKLSVTHPSGQIFGSTVVPLNQWHHVAVTRDASNTLRIFLNGVVDSSTANWTQSIFQVNPRIGYYNNTPLDYFTGYISNLRVVSGTAVYTSAFTPSTSPLTPIANTSLLTCQSNRFIDNSTNNFAITKTGEVSVQAFGPFNTIREAVPISYSNYFDGTGDYLSIPDNTALDLATGGGSTAPFTGAPSFTIECWFYCTALTADFQNILNKDGTSGTSYTQYSFVISSAGLLKLVLGHGENASTGNGTEQSFTILSSIALNTWYHVAACQATPNQIYTFLNGTLIATTTRTQYMANGGGKPLLIGYQTGQPAGNYFNGFVSNVRIIKGTALYTTSFTPSTTPLTAIANTSLLTCQSTMLIDNSTNAFTITANGDVKPRILNPFGYTAQSATSYTPSLHGGSIYLDGTGDYLNLPTNTLFGFGNGDFTIEFWAYPTVNARQDWIDITDGTNRVLVYYSGSAIVFYSVPTNAAAITGPAMVLNTWQHIALSKSAGSSRLFVNGVQVGSTYASNQNYFTTSPLTIGKDSAGATHVSGYMSDIRIIKGTGIYTSNFLPPTQPVSNYSTNIPSSLLLNFTNGGIVDQHSGVVLETVGNARLSTNSKKYDNASMYFNGTTAGLLAPTSPLFAFGSADFTIEFWYYPTSTAGTNPNIMCNNSGSGSFISGQWSLHAPHSVAANKYSFWVASSSTSAPLLTSATNISINTWTHIAITRSGNNWKLFLNGAVDATATFSGILDNGTTNPQYIGYQPNVESGRYITGYIDDLRMTKGYVRYTGTFVPPAALQTTSS